MSPTFCASLLKGHEIQLWKKAACHRFVLELCMGILPKEVFRRYVVQDLIFCKAIKKVLGAILFRSSPDISVHYLEEFGMQVMPGEELRTLEEFVKELEISEEELDSPNMVTCGFMGYMLSLAGVAGNTNDALVGLFVVNEVYNLWASAAVSTGEKMNPQNEMYLKWMEIHRKSSSQLEWVKGLLNKKEEGGGGVGKRYFEIVRETLLWEIAFWDSCFKPSEWNADLWMCQKC